MEIIMGTFISKSDGENIARARKISHSDIYVFSKEVVLNLLFNESLYDNFNLKIKGVEDEMLKIQFLEHGKPEPQIGWSLEEFKEKCNNGDFDGI